MPPKKTASSRRSTTERRQTRSSRSSRYDSQIVEQTVQSSPQVPESLAAPSQHSFTNSQTNSQELRITTAERFFDNKRKNDFFKWDKSKKLKPASFQFVGPNPGSSSNAENNSTRLHSTFHFQDMDDTPAFGGMLLAQTIRNNAGHGNGVLCASNTPAESAVSSSVEDESVVSRSCSETSVHGAMISEFASTSSNLQTDIATASFPGTATTAVTEPQPLTQGDSFTIARDSGQDEFDSDDEFEQFALSIPESQATQSQHVDTEAVAQNGPDSEQCDELAFTESFDDLVICGLSDAQLMGEQVQVTNTSDFEDEFEDDGLDEALLALPSSVPNRVVFDLVSQESEDEFFDDGMEEALAAIPEQKTLDDMDQFDDEFDDAALGSVDFGVLSSQSQQLAPIEHEEDDFFDDDLDELSMSAVLRLVNSSREDERDSL